MRPSRISKLVADLSLALGVAQFQVVFKFIGVHDANDGNAILFEDEVLIVEVSTLGQLAEVNAGFGDREAINRTSGWFPQSEVLAS